VLHFRGKNFAVNPIVGVILVLVKKRHAVDRVARQFFVVGSVEVDAASVYLDVVAQLACPARRLEHLFCA